MTCMFVELSIAMKLFRAERYSVLFPFFNPRLWKVVLHWAYKCTSSISPNWVSIFRVDIWTRKISPFHMFCNARAVAIWRVSRRDKKDLCAATQSGRNWETRRMAMFVKQISRAKILPMLESLVQLRCVVRVIIPKNLIPRTSVSCLHWMFCICFALSFGSIDNVRLLISILELVAFSYVLMISVTFS
jgi:hypothetical protein